ncbi:HAD family hydrolase [Pseudoalteromonas sp. MMG005]|uniref:HAD family hydrolase n=1 Tax=Pseudoalteromonas sp. MMG005 TaxID=2822682 RepID=UPI001B3A3C31|nr:HAD family hydrolase [Pseudoalteromonas sp. MMG005]MBQ4846330.1 HAD family hydrolase [Pseudoalteromonas sp. MMG005]
MKIGIDFDNTIADYTGVFYNVALDLGWIPKETGNSKPAVKYYFIQQNQETRWTQLQGIVYGKEIHHARPYPHSLEVLKLLKEQGHTLFLVSHKTRYPIIGDKVNFHNAATEWLSNNGFINSTDAPLELERLFFNETLKKKVRKIRELQCDAFIDDLQKIFNHTEYPHECKAILFDPLTKEKNSNTAACWADISNLLC